MAVQIKDEDGRETPTQQIMKNAAKVVDVTDARGRVIRLRKSGYLAQAQLYKAAGEKGASNGVYMRLIMPLSFIECIDGNPIPPPDDEADIEHLLEKLDHDGMEAVTDAIFKHFSGQDAAKDKAELKN